LILNNKQIKTMNMVEKIFELISEYNICSFNSVLSSLGLSELSLLFCLKLFLFLFFIIFIFLNIGFIIFKVGSERVTSVGFFNLMRFYINAIG
jgi:hypothetical protein